MILELIIRISYLGSDVTYKSDSHTKLSMEGNMCGSPTLISLQTKTRNETLPKFYKIVELSALLYGRESWASDTKEVTEYNQ
jgi:hypothetical protein